MTEKRQFIYADNAATTKLDPLAFKAMLSLMRDDYANASSPYSFSRAAKKALADARMIIANVIGVQPEEIFFTSGGTESNNWAIKGLAEARSPFGKHIITSAIEHHAVLKPCAHLERHGYEITYLPVDSCGCVSKVDLAKAIRSDTIAITIMMANNEIGSIQDISGLTEIAEKNNILFHTDAIQAVGHIPIKIDPLRIDLLSASAHKFNGPKGVGFLFVRNGTPLVNFIDGGRQENGQRGGTENVASIVGMAVALKNNFDKMFENTTKMECLSDIFRQSIQNRIPSAIFNGNEESHLAGHISLSIPGISGEALLHFLDLKGIAIATSAACNSNSVDISHVLKAINLSETLAKGTIRISFGCNNTENDPIAIADAIFSYMELVKSRSKV